MSRKPIRAFTLACASAALLSCYRVSDQPRLAGQDVHLTVLHTADIHSRILPYSEVPGLIDRGLGSCAELEPFGGAARLAHLIHRERARSDRVIHVDSGDVFEGAPIFNAFKGEVEMKVMAYLRPEAMVIGNHEFDLGPVNIATQYQTFGFQLFPMLAANYVFQDPADPKSNQLGRLLKPYTIVDIRGLRIALIGMGNTSSMVSIEQGGNALGISPLEPIEALRQYVNLLEPEVDLVFVVSHMGLTANTTQNDAEDEELISGYRKIVPKNAVQKNWKVMTDEGNGTVQVFIPGVVGVDAIFGGHLHIVLNPPKVLIDPEQRPVLLVDSGAFARFLGRLDVLVHIPKDDEPAPHGAEIKSHDFEILPITNRVPKLNAGDVTDCSEQDMKSEDFDDEVGSDTQCLALASAAQESATCAIADACRQNHDACSKECRAARRSCGSVPAPVDPFTLELLDPYVNKLYKSQELNKILAYATDRITRFGVSGEDSPLGNLLTDAMRRRNRIEAQFALTNTLGIRTNMEAGPVTTEAMYNIFPFENTLTTIYLSGEEVQELFDFVTDKSSERGCQAQAQISGITFTQNCAQSLRNKNAPACTKDADCEGTMFESMGTSHPVRCVNSRCFKSPSDDIKIAGKPINRTESYKAAVNDYIGRGGSGFDVLRRNTTKVDTTLSLRDALVEYMRELPAQGGVGRVCGSQAMVNPKRPTQPLVVYDKAESPTASCQTKPTGCTPLSGIFFDCQEDATSVRFYCIPFDFPDPSPAHGDECDGIAQLTGVFDTIVRTTTAAGQTCMMPISKTCEGQLHCCEKGMSDGTTQANFYCLIPYCVSPPPTGRIHRIVQ
jgi:2',3'-cyclic-nucleotide 2'-phosphodiesterase (5'-nucleotidase family)